MTPPLNPLAVPMVLLGLRTRDANAFCAGVGLVADTILPGQEYGLRYNAMKSHLTLASLSARVANELPYDATNPIGTLTTVQKAVIIAAMRSVVLEARDGERTQRWVDVRDKDAAYLFAAVKQLIGQ